MVDNFFDDIEIKSRLIRSICPTSFKTRIIRTYFIEFSEKGIESLDVGYDIEEKVLYKYSLRDKSFNSNNGRPAVLKYHPNGNISLEKYYIDGILHNIDGKPAITKYDIDGNIILEKYFIFGTEYNELEYLVKINIDKGDL